MANNDRNLCVIGLGIKSNTARKNVENLNLIQQFIQDCIELMLKLNYIKRNDKNPSIFNVINKTTNEDQNLFLTSISSITSMLLLFFNKQEQINNIKYNKYQEYIDCVSSLIEKYKKQNLINLNGLTLYYMFSQHIIQKNNSAEIEKIFKIISKNGEIKEPISQLQENIKLYIKISEYNSESYTKSLLLSLCINALIVQIEPYIKPFYIEVLAKLANYFILDKIQYKKQKVNPYQKIKEEILTILLYNECVLEETITYHDIVEGKKTRIEYISAFARNDLLEIIWEILLQYNIVNEVALKEYSQLILREITVDTNVVNSILQEAQKKTFDYIIQDIQENAKQCDFENNYNGQIILSDCILNFLKLTIKIDPGKTNLIIAQYTKEKILDIFSPVGGTKYFFDKFIQYNLEKIIKQIFITKKELEDIIEDQISTSLRKKIFDALENQSQYFYQDKVIFTNKTKEILIEKLCKEYNSKDKITDSQSLTTVLHNIYCGNLLDIAKKFSIPVDESTISDTIFIDESKVPIDKPDELVTNHLGDNVQTKPLYPFLEFEINTDSDEKQSNIFFSSGLLSIRHFRELYENFQANFSSFGIIGENPNTDFTDDLDESQQDNNNNNVRQIKRYIFAGPMQKYSFGESVFVDLTLQENKNYLHDFEKLNYDDPRATQINYIINQIDAPINSLQEDNDRNDICGIKRWWSNFEKTFKIKKNNIILDEMSQGSRSFTQTANFRMPDSKDGITIRYWSDITVQYYESFGLIIEKTDNNKRQYRVTITQGRNAHFITPNSKNTEFIAHNLGIEYNDKDIIPSYSNYYKNTQGPYPALYFVIENVTIRTDEIFEFDNIEKSSYKNDNIKRFIEFEYDTLNKPKITEISMYYSFPKLMSIIKDWVI
jgi:hypothetical protein